MNEPTPVAAAKRDDADDYGPPTATATTAGEPAGKESPGPVVAVLGGINGAGKTTASYRLLRELLRIPVFVNADTIARGLNAFAVESEAVKAGRVMLDHLRDLATRRQSFAFESTLSARTYAPWLGELREAGYTVHLFYYWLRSPDLAIGRVACRVQAGGHHIPDETIRRRYSRSVANFLKLYRPRATTWQVYDNSQARPQLIAFSTTSTGAVVDPETWGQLTTPDTTVPRRPGPIDHAAAESAHERAARDARLEHARLGRFVCESRDGEVVWITPEEVFARYGLDANGRPRPQ